MINGFYMAILAACVVSITFDVLGAIRGSEKKMAFAFSLAMIAHGAVTGLK